MNSIVLRLFRHLSHFPVWGLVGLLACLSAQAGAQSTSFRDHETSWGLLQGERSEIVTSDGVRLVARYVAPRDSTMTVVMVPMIGGSAAPYGQLQSRLISRGIGTLVFDLRGQGESTATLGGAVDYRRFKNAPQGEWAKVTEDLEAVLSFLEKRGVETSGVALIGASIGANAALQSAARHPDIPKVVLLSPGEEYRGVESLQAARSYGKRPLLIVSGEKDSYAAASAPKLAELAKQGGAEVTLKLYNTNSHGTALLNKYLQSDILEWVVTK